MIRNRPIAGFVVAAVLGFATPRLVPQAWLADILVGALFLALVWAGLAGGSARGGGGSSRPVRALSWLLFGTSRPGAEVVDNQALWLFWMTLVYLASLGIGAFAAVAA